MGLMGEQIGHYRIARQIGQGGMGEVYLAEILVSYDRLPLRLYIRNDAL